MYRGGSDAIYEAFTMSKDLDNVYAFTFGSYNAASAYKQNVRLVATLTDNTAGSEDSELSFYNLKAGTLTKQATIKNTGVFNLVPISAATASALTPAEGDIVIVNTTNGTFTSVGLWSYVAASWAK